MPNRVEVYHGMGLTLARCQGNWEGRPFQKQAVHALLGGLLASEENMICRFFQDTGL